MQSGIARKNIGVRVHMLKSSAAWCRVGLRGKFWRDAMQSGNVQKILARGCGH
jgi:hypothetical protein